MSSILKIDLLGYFILTIKYLLADGGLKGLLKFISHFVSYNLQDFFELYLIEYSLYRIYLNTCLSFSVENYLLFSEKSKGSNDSYLNWLFYWPIVVDFSKIGKMQYLVVVFSVIWMIFCLLSLFVDLAKESASINVEIVWILFEKIDFFWNF